MKIKQKEESKNDCNENSSGIENVSAYRKNSAMEMFFYEKGFEESFNSKNYERIFRKGFFASLPSNERSLGLNKQQKKRQI